MIAAYQGALRDAETHLAEGLVGCQTQGDALNAATALLGLGALAAARGDYGRGTALLEASLAAPGTCRIRGWPESWPAGR
jgi:hypothetical protein